MSGTRRGYAAEDLDRNRGLTKRERELLIVEGLLARLGINDYSLSSSDRPDVWVTLGKDDGAVRLACEVQTLHSDEGPGGSEHRRFRERWITIMEAVLAQLKAEGTVPYCRVDFARRDFGNCRNEQIVNELVAAGRQLRSRTELSFPRDKLPILSSLLSQITVINPDGEGLLWWPSHLQTGVIDGEALDDTVRRAVDEKTRAALGYDWQGCAERWLVLYAQGYGLVDVFGGARDIVLDRNASSPFTRVVIWDNFSGDVWMLLPAFAIILDARRKLGYVNRLPESVRSFVRWGQKQMRPQN